MTPPHLFYLIYPSLFEHSDCTPPKYDNCQNILTLLALRWSTVFFKMHEWVKYVQIRKEGNILFNDTLNTFYLGLYRIGHNYDKGPFR